MAAPISQDEIDALLESGGDFDDQESVDTDISGSADAPRKTGSKYISITKAEPYRFKFIYKSPVLKSSDYVLDPEDENMLDHSVPVVRRLMNFSNSRNQV
ncbi:hypothetical protein ACFL7D_03010 [candidate division KSB1 bacterium]